MNSEQIAKWDAAWCEKFPKRISKSQKEPFLQMLQQELRARQFETERLDLRMLFENRLLVTRCEAPKIIFMAHYDTPTILPLPFAWLFALVGHTRQLQAVLLLILLLQLPDLLSNWLQLAATTSTLINAIFYLLLAASLLVLLLPNPHNREDNTSGVIALMALADWLQDKPEMRQHVQLVILDNEELGLLGSKALRDYWQQQEHPFTTAVIVNLDCVTRGEVPLIVYHNRHDSVAKALAPYIQPYLPQARPFQMRLIPLSDNYTFRDLGAVDISFADKTIIPGGYYIPRIHSPADNDFSAERLALLLHGLTDFVTDTVGKRDNT